MATAETIHSLHRNGNNVKIEHTYFGSGQQSNKGKDQKKCVLCNLDHSSSLILDKGGCKESHNRLLHRDKFVRTNNEEDEKKKEAPSITEGEQAKSNERSHTATMHATKQPKVEDEFVLQTVPIILKNGNGRLVVNALLDDGSTKTYVNSDIAAELNVKGALERVNIGVLNGRSESLETMPVEFGLYKRLI